MSLVRSVLAAFVLLVPFALWQSWVLDVNPLQVAMLTPPALVSMALGLGLFLAPTAAIVGLCLAFAPRLNGPPPHP